MTHALPLGQRSARDAIIIYVHEITEIPAEVQARILQLFPHMTEGLNAVRLVASSSRDLVKAARGGFLRHELAYRFPVLLKLPPLRERPDDIPELVAHFARRVAERFGGKPVTFGAAAIRRLKDYDWPGNVGELCNLVERCALFSDRTEPSPPGRRRGSRRGCTAHRGSRAGFPPRSGARKALGIPNRRPRIQ